MEKIEESNFILDSIMFNSTKDLRSLISFESQFRNRFLDRLFNRYTKKILILTFFVDLDNLDLPFRLINFSNNTNLYIKSNNNNIIILRRYKITKCLGTQYSICHYTSKEKMTYKVKFEAESF